jgi:hypothetical protein
VPGIAHHVDGVDPPLATQHAGELEPFGRGGLIGMEQHHAGRVGRAGDVHPGAAELRGQVDVLDGTGPAGQQGVVDGQEFLTLHQ